MRVLTFTAAAAAALCAGGTFAATLPQGYALLQAPATAADNIGAGVVAGATGALFGTLGSTMYALVPPNANGGTWIDTVLGQAWSTGTGAVADGFEFAEGKVALDAAGAVYAATALNLESGGGVLRFTPPASGGAPWTKTVLWSFAPGANGASVNAGLLVDGSGAVYGTTRGGSTLACAPGCGFGSVFKLTPPAIGQAAWSLRILYAFTGAADGERPDGTLSMDGSGTLYGTAAGGANGDGVVFRLAPGVGAAPWTETTLYSFTGGADGAVPTGGVVADATGNLYGLTAGCTGTPCNAVGSVYRLAKPAAAGGAWTLATLAGSVGFPAYRGNLAIDGTGALYGGSGYYCGAFGIDCGTMFRLAPPASGQGAWSYTQLYDLGQSGTPAALIAANGVLFGTADEGAGCTTAAGGCMTVLALTGTGFAQ